MKYRLLSYTVSVALAAVVLGSLATQPLGAQAPLFCAVEIQFPLVCDSQGMLGTPLQPGANCRIANIDGFPREYLVYVPRNPEFHKSNKPLPVVFMLHGSGGDQYEFHNRSGWSEKAEEVGIIAVYPTSPTVYVIEDNKNRCSTKWNIYGSDDGLVFSLDIKPKLMNSSGVPVLDYPPASPWPADDVKFQRAILDDVRSTGYVDPERIFVSGFSNGASFAARVAIELSEHFAAGAWSSGGLAVQTDGDLPPVPARRIPVAMEFGSCDDGVGLVLGYAFDSDACQRGAVAGVTLNPDELLAFPQLSATVKMNLDTFGLQQEPHSTQTSGNITCMSWRQPTGGNTGGTLFRFGVLAGVTHQYPNGQNNPNKFRNADRFWNFFTNTASCQ